MSLETLPEVCLDLGCARCKPSGFIGVDRFPLPGVDVVADLDQPLPFADDSVDLVYASHSLEHLPRLMETMREVYRICRHGAQICIVAPYNEQKLNLANPYHLCVFNEHTPRFWTDIPSVPIDLEEYWHPHASSWGLARSDHSNPGLDLRIVRMEFFYFPEYRHLEKQRLRELRREKIDVCDQIVYHLIAWKPVAGAYDNEFTDRVAAFVPFDPEYVRVRRNAEAAAAALSAAEKSGQVSELDRLSTGLAELNETLTAIPGEREALIALLDETHQQIAAGATQLAALRTEVSETFVQVRDRCDELVTLQKAGEAMRDSLVVQVADEVEDRVARLNDNRAANDRVLARHKKIERNWRREHFRLQSKLDAAESLVAQLQSRHQTAETELAAERERWMEAKVSLESLFTQLLSVNRPHMLGRLLNGARQSDVWHLVSPKFDDLRAFCKHARLRKRNRILTLSTDLRTVPYIEYRLPAFAGEMTSLLLAINPVFPARQGMVGVEIVNPEARIVAHVVAPLAKVSASVPTRFVLPEPIVLGGEGWLLRVFARNTDVPVTLYELQERRLFRRNVLSYPFLALNRRSKRPVQPDGPASPRLTAVSGPAKTTGISRRTAKAFPMSEWSLGQAGMVDGVQQNSVDLLMIIEGEIATTHLIDRVLAACQVHGIHCRKRMLQKLRVDDIGPQTLPLFVRCGDPMVVPWIDALAEAGHPYLYYIDDNFWMIMGDSPLARYYQHPSVRRSLELAVSEAQTVITNSHELAQFIGTFNSSVVTLPPFFDFGLIEDVPTPGSTEMRIGFAGSPSRIDDLDIVRPAIESLLRAHPKLVFEFAGVLPRGIVESDRVRFFPYTNDYKSFVRFQAERGWAVGLAPLRDNAANQCKTNNKYREYGACRIAGVYSDLIPYRRSVEDGATGLLVTNDPEAWRTALESLIRDPARCRQMGDAAFRDVKERYCVNAVASEWARCISAANRKTSDQSPRAIVLDRSLMDAVQRRCEHVRLQLGIAYGEGGLSCVLRKAVNRLSREVVLKVGGQ